MGATGGVWGGGSSQGFAVPEGALSFLNTAGVCSGTQKSDGVLHVSCHPDEEAGL